MKKNKHKKPRDTTSIMTREERKRFFRNHVGYGCGRNILIALTFCVGVAGAYYAFSGKSSAAKSERLPENKTANLRQAAQEAPEDQAAWDEYLAGVKHPEPEVREPRLSSPVDIAGDATVQEMRTYHR